MPCKRSSEDVRKAAVALLRGNLSGLEQQRSCYVCYGSHRTKDCKMFELGVVANEMPPAAHAVQNPGDYAHTPEPCDHLFTPNNLT